MANGLLGSLSNFDPKYSSFSVFSERLKQFFIANKISDAEQKRAILLNMLSEECYVLIRNLCIPDLSEEKTYDCLIKLMTEHFTHVKSYFAERLKFYNGRREPTEGIADWAARVKSLAMNCGFSTELQMIMRDIFVTGVNHDKIMDRLFEEDASLPTFTFQLAVKIALSKESALKEHQTRESVGGTSIKMELVNYQQELMSRGTKQRSTNRTNQGHIYGSKGGNFKTNVPKWEGTTAVTTRYTSASKCSVCGRTNHASKDCASKNVLVINVELRVI